MRHITNPLLAAILLAASTGAALPAEKLPGPYRAQVTEIVDGDTFRAKVHVWLGQENLTLVRIDGIDTPEKNGKCQREKDMAAQATQVTTGLMAEGPVELLDVQHDKYANRVRARVVAGGKDVARELMCAGLARPYGGEARKTWCTITIVPKC